MAPVVITISGLPGSGKTTVARLVAKELGLEHVYAGDIFRRQAAEAGVTLEEYTRRAERIAGREGGEAKTRLREIQAREASDARRYREIYGFDYHDRGRYDLVLDTDGRTPAELAARIVEHARRGA